MIGQRPGSKNRPGVNSPMARSVSNAIAALGLLALLVLIPAGVNMLYTGLMSVATDVLWRTHEELDIKDIVWEYQKVGGGSQYDHPDYVITSDGIMITLTNTTAQDIAGYSQLWIYIANLTGAELAHLPVCAIKIIVPNGTYTFCLYFNHFGAWTALFPSAEGVTGEGYTWNFTYIELAGLQQFSFKPLSDSTIRILIHEDTANNFIFGNVITSIYIYRTDTRITMLADMLTGASGIIMFVAGLFATPILSWKQVKRLFTRARRR